MARVISWTIVAVAVLNAGFLLALPLLAGRAAEGMNPPRPVELPVPSREEQAPEPPGEPGAPVSELHEALRLPRVDESLSDEHSRASLAAYRDGDYQKAFEEAMFSLDPAPLEENVLYRALQETDEVDRRANGRGANEAVDRALEPVLREQDPGEVAARLNNAAAMWVLSFYDTDPSRFPSEPEEAGELASRVSSSVEELAYQAADLDPSYCPALLNLTLFNGMQRADAPAYPGLEPAGASGSSGETLEWTNHYAPEGCEDPALLYYLAQSSILQGIAEEDLSPTLEMIDRLQAEPRWAGLAHSLRGDTYYWAGLYELDRTTEKRPFTAQRYFKMSLDEYAVALALQPDDPAIRHGMALAYLGLGETEKALQEAEAALREAAPASPRLQQTLISAYEASGDLATAARLNRELLSSRQPAPLSLVPYSAISHGADRYYQLRVQVATSAAAASAFFDDDVIKAFEPTDYYSEAANWYSPRGLDQYREEFGYYDLLRKDLLAGDAAAFGADLARAPGAVRDNESTLLLIGAAGVLEEPDGRFFPEARAAINKFVARQYPYADPGVPEPEANDLFYREAGNFFREHEQYGDALRIYDVWRDELERDGAGKERKAEAENLRGEALFLDGEYGEALASFDQALGLRPGWPRYLVRKAFMHEKLGNYTDAEDLYRYSLDAMARPNEWNEGEEEDPADYYAPDNYQAAKHLGDMLLRQGKESADEGNDGAARALYEDAVRAYRETLERFGDLGTPGTAAASNLGAALLMQGDYEAGAEVLQLLVRPVDESAEGWRTDIIPDEHNPLFHLNLGYAYEKDGETDLAAGHYATALVESGPTSGGAGLELEERSLSYSTLYPALNDLGTLAAEEGRLEEAKSYFGAALRVKPDYARASYNTGVALLRAGPGSFLEAQGYMARAVAQDPTLSQAGYDYVHDNELYFVRLSLADRVSPSWEFTRETENGVGAVSLLALALLLGRAGLGFARAKFQETIVSKMISELGRVAPAARLPRLLARAREGWFRFLGFGVPSYGGPWSTPLALLVSAPAVALVMGWGLLWGDSEGRVLMLATLFYLVAVSLLVHHAGHILAAMRFGIKARGAPWPAGIVQALGLVAIGGPAVAPTPADLLEGAEGRERERSLVYLAGPAASILFALLLFVAFLVGHVPLLRLGATVNLSVAAVSLLLLPPLDGAMVGGRGRYARPLVWTGAALAALALVAYFGNELLCRLGPGGSCWGI